MALSSDAIGLIFRINANSQQAKQEIASLRAELNTHLDAIKGSFGNLTPAIGGVENALTALVNPATLVTLGIGALVTGVVAATGALVKMALEGATLADDLGDLSTSTGIAVDKLFLLQTAGKLGGASMQEITGALLKFEKTVATASPEVQKLSSKLGLDLKNAIADPTDGFFKFAKILSDLPPTANRVAIAQEFLGRSGAKLIASLIALGEQGEEFMAMLKRMGVTLDEQTTAKLGKVDDSVKLLGVQWDVLKIKIADEAGPAIINTIHEISKTIEALAPAIAKTTSFLAGAMSGLLGGLRGAIAGGRMLDPIGGFFKGIDQSAAQQVLDEMLAKWEGNKTGGGKDQSAAGGTKEKAQSESRARIQILQEELKQKKILFQQEADALKDALDRQAISRAEFTGQMIAKAEELHDAEMALLKAERAEAEQGDLKDNQRAVKLAQIKTKEMQLEREFAKEKSDFARAANEDLEKQLKLLMATMDRLSEGAFRIRKEVQSLQLDARQSILERDKSNLARLGPGANRGAVSKEQSRIEIEAVNIAHDRYLQALEKAQQENNAQLAQGIISQESHDDKVKALHSAELAELDAYFAEKARITREGELASMPDIGQGGQRALLQENTSMFDAFKASATAALKEVGASAQNFQQLMGSMFSTIAGGLQNMLAGFFATGKLGGQAFRQMTASILASIAVQSIVKAIFEHAEGLAALANFNIPAAVAHFAASTFYIKTAAIAGIGGIALAATAGGGGSTAGAGGGAGGNGQPGRGNLTIDQGGRQPQPIIIQLHGELGAAAIVNKVITNYKDNGPLRQTIQRDLGFSGA